MNETNIDPTNPEQRQYLLSLFEKDPIFFGQFFLPQAFSSKPAPFHREMIDANLAASKLTQQPKNTTIVKRSVIVPRGHAKTTVNVKLLLLHAILHNRFKYAMHLTNSAELAEDNLSFVRGELESNQLLKSFYAPNADPEDPLAFQAPNGQWNRSTIDTNVNNTISRVKAFGSGKSVRGTTFGAYRPDVIMVDDLEDAEGVAAKERRQKLLKRGRGDVRPCCGPKGGYFLIIGTILHFDSILNNIKENEHDSYGDFTAIEYKAIQRDPNTDEETALWEDAQPLEKLYKIQEEYIAKGEEATFSREYLNEPIAESERMFAVQDIKESIIDTTSPEFPPLSSLFITAGLDLAVTQRTHSDYSALTVIGVSSTGDKYVLYAERFKESLPEIADRIVDVYQMYRPRVVGIEKIGIVHAFLPILNQVIKKSGEPICIEPVSVSHTSKIERANSLAPFFRQRAIHLQSHHVDLLHELSQFPMGKNDDLIDASEISHRLLPLQYDGPSEYISQGKSSSPMDTYKYRNF